MTHKLKTIDTIGKWDFLLLDMTGKDIARFWSKVVKMKSGCWYRRSRVAYPKYSKFFGYKGKLHFISRVAYILLKNKLPAKDKEICHTCDHGSSNGPVCVNPKHIKLRSHGWNMLDMHSKNRHPRLLGVKNPKAKLCEFEVHQIRIQYIQLIKKYTPKLARGILSKRFNVSGTTIQNIIYRYKGGWRHVA